LVDGEVRSSYEVCGDFGEGFIHVIMMIVVICFLCEAVKVSLTS